MRPFSLRPARSLVAIAAAFMLVLAACSDDDEGSSGSSDDSTAEEAASSGPAEEDLAFCDALVATEAVLTAGGPEGEVDAEAAQAAAEELTATTPEALADDVPVLVEAVETTAENPESDTPEGFEEAYANANDFQVESCGFQELEAAAIDYAYQGLPETLEAGPTVVRLTNEGTEFHELLLLRVNDDVTETAEELLALPQEEAESKVTTAGVAFAPVGATAGASADLEAGRYIAVCFLPVGSTPEAFAAGGPPDAPPHALEGMFQELQVG